MCNVPNIFKVNNKDTRMMSGASFANFEHILHFILLLILLTEFEQINVVWAGETVVQSINLFPVTVKNILSYGLGKFVGIYVMFINPI